MAAVISPESKELATLALQRAQQTWGRSAWARLSPRERTEKVGAELLSILASWQLDSLSDDLKYVGGIARTILRTLDDEEAR